MIRKTAVGVVRREQRVTPTAGYRMILPDGKQGGRPPSGETKPFPDNYLTI
jgi:hypothetical protein